MIHFAGVRDGERGRAGVGVEIGFQLAAYDHTQPLVIDPVLVYAGYLGGVGWDRGQGNAYLTGWTSSDAASFPVLINPPPRSDG
jgi:hypothetical protein